MDIIIRKMLLADRKAVEDMMKTLYSSPALLTHGSAEIYKNNIDNCIEYNPYLEGYVFDNGKEVVGYAMAAKSFSTEFGKPCIWLEDLFIKEEYRSQGLGSRYFAFIQDKYPQRLFRLEVEKNNPATKLYEKMGFSPLPYLEMVKNK